MGQAIHALAPEGTLVLLAVDNKEILFPPATALIGSRLRVMGNPSGSIKDMRETLEVAAKHGVRPMIETHPLENAQQALERVRDGKPRFRAVLTMN